LSSDVASSFFRRNGKEKNADSQIIRWPFSPHFPATIAIFFSWQTVHPR